MKAFIFLEGDLSFALEGTLEDIEKYMRSFRHGASHYSGDDVVLLYRNEKDEILNTDTTDAPEQKYMDSISTYEKYTNVYKA